MLTLSKHDLEIIKKALLEDLEPNGDITTKFSVEPDLLAEANIIAKEDGILACSHIAQEILDEAKNTLLGFYFDRTGSSDNSRLINGISQKAEISFSLADGEKFKTGQFIKSSLPMNFTVKDSIFVLDHNFEEEIDVLWFEDTGL